MLSKPILPGLFEDGCTCGEGGGGGPAAHYSKNINDNDKKFIGVVENYKLINLVSFNCHMTSLLRHNDVITVEICSFYKNLPIQVKKFRGISDLKNRKVNGIR